MDEWRNASKFICDHKIPNKPKGKFYQTAIRPAMFYGNECWALKGQQEQKMGVAERRILRWMSRHTRKDKLQNSYIWNRVGVAPIEEKIIETRLRWFGHVQRRPPEALVRKVDQMVFSPIRKCRGRSKRILVEVIKRNLWLNSIFESLIHDRKQLRSLICVADPT